MRRRKHIARAITRAPRFVMEPCARCKAPLFTPDGMPRWEILEDRFVCLEACQGSL